MFTLLSGKSILVCYCPFGWEDRFCYQSGPLLKSHNGRQALPQETLNLKTGGVPHHKKSLLKTVTLQKREPVRIERLGASFEKCKLFSHHPLSR